METFLPTEFDYWLMPGKISPGFAHEAEHNELFKFWKEFWSDVLLEVTGERRQLTADEFLRQDYFAVLFHRKSIVGIHAYSVFNLSSDAARQHTYFGKYFTPEFMTELSNRQANAIMTMEYFSVAKEWRTRRVGVSFGKVLVALGLRIAEERMLDGTITAARADVPAANIAASLGAESLTPPIDVLGKPTELMFFPSNSVREPEDGKYQTWINNLWARRYDLTKDAGIFEFKKTG